MRWKLWRAILNRQSLPAQAGPIRNDLDEELRFHLEQQIAQNIAAGMSPEAARYAALRAFGGVEQMKEECRDSRGGRFLEELMQDVRYGLRILARSPGFTAVAVLTLALGIGANTAVFSLLDSVLLRPLPYSHPDRLFKLLPTEAQYGPMAAGSYPDFQDWKEQSHTFEAMAAYEEHGLNLTGTTQPERLRALFSTPGLFALLGTHPALGREFSPNDGQHVALLSYALWQRRFATDAGVIGKPIYLDGRAYTVLGVLPPRFYFPPDMMQGELTAEVFVPAVPNPDRGWFYLRVVGRLAPGATRQQAQAEMNGIAARLAQTYPKAGHGQEVKLDWLPEVAAGGMRQTALLLFGAVAFVLLIACANVTNLLLSRGATREREIAVRAIVGATRSRLVRQLLTESLLLAALGGALGVALADQTLHLLANAVPESTMFYTRVHDVGIQLNAVVFAFSALLSALSTALFGALPAWRATKPLQTSAARFHAVRTRGALVALEVALSFVLLAGAGLTMRSLIRLREVDVGFHPQGLLTMRLSLSGKKYSSPQERAAFSGQVLERLRSLPAVLSAAVVTDLPLTRYWTVMGFELPGGYSKRGSASYHAASPDYFRAMGIPLLSGRGLLDSDSARTPLVGVANRSMARRYWPNENPVGKSIIAYPGPRTATSKGISSQLEPRELEIVGVVGDDLQFALDAPPHPELFVPFPQWPANEISLVVRTKSLPSSLIPVVEKAVWNTDPDQPVTDVKTMDQWVAKEAAATRFVLELVGAFALIAIVLAAVGIYGVVSYWTRQRTHEIGIRMALGAAGRGVVWMLVRQNARWLLIGITAGIAGALALTRLLGGYLYAVRPTDPTTFIAVGFLLTAVALMACYLPARRASKVDPMVALRYE
jgi:putative ABC transport system permease protein